MLYAVHFFPGLTLLVLALALQTIFTKGLLRSPGWGRRRPLLLAVNAVLALVSISGYVLGFDWLTPWVPPHIAAALEACALVELMTLLALTPVFLVWRYIPQVRPERRRFLQAAGGALIAAPYVIAGTSALERNHFHLNEFDVPIPNLPHDLQGLRLVQLSDIHLSAFLHEKDLARAVDMANSVRPDLILVTGDLITRAGDPVDTALRQLARLRAEAGILGCMGNHEAYVECEDYVAAQGRKIGIDFLRSEARVMRFGSAAINFAGVDYQSFNKPYLVGAEKLVKGGALNVLLSHNPDVFPVASNMGFDLTVSGHTHGGQVNFEILHQNVNVARYFTRYVRGLYRQDKSSVYVSTGIGTIGVPVRVGAPAEIALLRLCAG